MDLYLLDLPHAMASCLSAWEDLFRLAQRECGRSGRSGTYRTQRLDPRRPGAFAAALKASPQATLMVPSLWTEEPRREVLEAEAAALDLARAAQAAGWTLASVCAGNFLLARAGLLEGLSATTHWSLAAAFKKKFPEISLAIDEMLLDHGQIILGGGITAYFDVGLRLLARSEGPDFSRHCARILLVDPVRQPQWVYAEGDAAPLVHDEAIKAAEAWLETRLETGVSLREWAGAAGLEARTFERRFSKARGLSPSAYLQRRRLLKAKELLEFSALGWEAITEACGYHDPASFRRLFKEATGTTPGRYRRGTASPAEPGMRPGN